ncbi:GntR family transcriptional regulator [Nonomuraea sp. NPDC049480]|uniref:GntR family transcriptional regulator n=1 Tax=Nonomuraea sp. NPDC049480 TaxID=3364353 RepID=UPI0037B378D7
MSATFPGGGAWRLERFRVAVAQGFEVLVVVASAAAVELATGLGISRGTVREALRHLEQEGLVSAG